MRTSIFLVLLLAQLWTLSSQGELKKLGKTERENSERVLIRSKRRWVLSTVDLEEEYEGPFPKLLTTLFNDKQLDHTVRFSISGQGVTEDPKNVFSINEKTGVVYIHKPIDRETYPFFLVNFNVRDALTGEILDRTLAFNVAIKDKNDNPPVFTHEVLQAQVPENIKEGQLPVSLLATDKDEIDNSNSRVSMEILSQDPEWPKITLQALSTGTSSSIFAQLSFTGCFDYDKMKTHTLLVEAKDHGIPSLSSTATVIITVTDTNTHAPVFTASKYNTQVMEMATTEILRVAVMDQDTPNTTASKAVYTILKGNEGGNYEIMTDPATNEGVLRVIKGVNYETGSHHELQIGVENEEPLFSCVDGKPVSYAPDTLRENSAVNVSVTILNENDPPVFEKKITTVFRMEEEDPGDVLYLPTLTDDDSDVNNVSYALVEDPAKWLSIDPKTGKITTVKKMDRESPFVLNDTYTVVMTAVDNGKPPATGTGTLVIVLGDKNDNKPRLTSNNSIMCVNDGEQVTVKVVDDDNPPYGAPFTFMLGNEELQNQWKLDPPKGPETSLISLKNLPYGDYSIPLKIMDQQGLLSEVVMQVTVCNCRKVNMCRPLRPRSSELGGAALGVLLGSLLLLVLLLCMSFQCDSENKKTFQLNIQDGGTKGNQSLRSWNEEFLPKEEKPFILYDLPNNDYQKTTTSQLEPQLTQNVYQTASIPLTQRTVDYRDTADMMQTLRSYSTWSQKRTNSKTWSQNRTNSKTWNKNRTNSMKSNCKTISPAFEQYLSKHIERKLSENPDQQFDVSKYQPHEYDCEGTYSDRLTLDKLFFHSTGDLNFLEDLGPKFQTLGGICQQSMEEKNIKA